MEGDVSCLLLLLLLLVRFPIQPVMKAGEESSIINAVVLSLFFHFLVD